MLQLRDTSVILARLDPLTLKPASQRVDVGEYHDAWSLSPNRSRLAVGISAPGRRKRIGIMIVDLRTMKVVRRVETGVFAGALAWLSPRRLLAGLGQAFVSKGAAPAGGTVLVDPHTGAILRRWTHLSDPQASARTRDGFVMLFPGEPPRNETGTAPAQLAVVDPRGRLRSVVLERIRLAFREGVRWDEAGLAVDAARARAYVFAAEAPAAEVDLPTLRVSYHRVDPLFLNPGEVERTGELRWRYRDALWLGDGKVLVFGRDDFGRAGTEAFATTPAGATLVDTATWTSCVVESKAGRASRVAGRVVVYGGGEASRGLRAYTRDGDEVFRFLDRERVWDVQAAGGRAYVRTRSAVYVLDVKSGKVVSKIAPPRDLVDVVTAAP